VLKARVNERWTKDGTSGAIDWTEFDEETVECALSYLYIEDYDVRGRTFVGEQIEERNNDDQIGTFHSPHFFSLLTNIPFSTPSLPLYQSGVIGV
jgi:hypothetical protein